MLIGGLEKSTLIDYPPKVAATLFTLGCNFRCPFCHNPELVDPEKTGKQPQMDEGAFFSFLQSRKGLLDGVCLTGGEPTIQPDLAAFVGKIKKEGFLVKLDTNGSNPEVLENLFKKDLIDFIAMDIKSSKDKYLQATGSEADLEKIKKSINLIKKSNLDYEFRTTVVPGLTGRKEIEEIGRWLRGSKKFVLQQFRPQKTLDRSLKEIKPYSDEEIEELAEIARPYFDKVEVRGV